MRRYLRLYGCFVRFSFSRAMEFRLDFFFRIFMDLVWNAVHLGFLWLLFRHTPLLGGLDFDQGIVFAASFFLIDALHMTLFSNNMWWFPTLVNRGDLDYYLIRPVSPLFFLSLRDFAANSFVNLLAASGIMAWALARYPGSLSPGPLFLFFALLACGLLLHYCLNLLFLLPVFWLHSASGTREIFFTLSRYSQKPHKIYSGIVLRLLVTALPFALIASFPVQALFHGADLALVAHVLAVVVGLFALLLLAWKRGLAAYASASS
ncbi:MAG: ABC transporter permease [Planctomycetaceae bacterium]